LHDAHPQAHPRCGCRAGSPEAFGSTAISYIIKASYEGIGGPAVDGQATDSSIVEPRIMMPRSRGHEKTAQVMTPRHRA
jgi:hypothetical protein